MSHHRRAVLPELLSYGTSLTSIADLKDKEQLVYEKAMDRRNYPAIGKKLDPKKLADFEAIISDMCTRLYKIAHDFSTLPDEQKKEILLIDQALTRFAREDVGGPNSFHADPSRKLTEQEVERMRAKAETLKNHLKQFE